MNSPAHRITLLAQGICEPRYPLIQDIQARHSNHELRRAQIVPDAPARRRRTARRPNPPEPAATRPIEIRVTQSKTV